jgi:hypothetical protein
MAAGARRIVVTELRVLRRGQGPHGEWTLRAVSATTPQGAPIAARLKTFCELPVGEPVDVDVERQEHERHGVSFLLRPAGRRGRGPPAGELQRQLHAHEQAIRALAARVGALEDRAA